MRLSKILIALVLVIGTFHSSIYSQANSFAYPQSVFVDSPSGHIWITDFSNHRVLRFDVSSLTSVKESQQVSPPASTILFQNYPNPFNPSTTLNYELSVLSFVDLRVFDLLGREVAVLVDRRQEPGQYAVTFNAGGLPSGMYLYSLRSAAGYEVRTMCLVK
jgi:hypothetical protein